MVSYGPNFSIAVPVQRLKEALTDGNANLFVLMSNDHRLPKVDTGLVLQIGLLYLCPSLVIKEGAYICRPLRKHVCVRDQHQSWLRPRDSTPVCLVGFGPLTQFMHYPELLGFGVF